jgi:hypothetical protein
MEMEKLILIVTRSWLEVDTNALDEHTAFISEMLVSTYKFIRRYI